MKFLFTLFLLLVSSTTFAKNIVLSEANTLVLNTYVDSTPVANLTQKALELDAQYPTAGPIYLILNTGGGSIDSGINLIHALKNLKRPVHTIVIHAYSMGFAITQGLGKRYVLEYGDLMQHNAKGGFTGEFPGQVNNRLRFWVKRVLKLEAVTAKRSGKSMQELRKLFDNEYWCTGSDCVVDGFADEVVSVSCDATLAGTVDSTSAFPLGVNGDKLVELKFTDTFSKCPLVAEPLKSSVSLDGGSIFGNEKEIVDPQTFKKIKRFQENKLKTTPDVWLNRNPLFD